MHRAEISLSCNQLYYLETIGVMVMVFNATFNIISVICYIVPVSFIGGVNRSVRRKQSVPITTNVVSSNSAQARNTRYTIML
jgi:hypothetical protein